MMLKTRRQWRKEEFRRVKAGVKPADHLIIKYIYRRHQMDITPDGLVTTGTTPVLKERQIPLYAFNETQPCRRIGAVLLRDAYSRYFVDDAQKDTYLWWHNEWKTCRSYLGDEHIRKHLLEKEIYGIYGGDYTCFSAIDADYHGGDYGVFREQLTAVLKEIHGYDGWHYSFGPRGVHIIRVHPRLPTSNARADLRQLLQEIDARHPQLRQRAVEAGMRPISDWEVYPDPKQGFRLPLAMGRTVLLDKPCLDLTTYIEWQIEPRYCLLDNALAEIFKTIQPAPVVANERDEGTKKKKIISEVGRAFGSLRGRYAKVLVDFWLGRSNPLDSLNCAILLTARMMPCYFDHQQDAINYIEELVDDLPDTSFSDRLSSGKRKAVSRIVQQAVKAAFEGNGHQPNPQISNEKLAKTFQAWENKGFSLVDRSTWNISGVVLGNDFCFSVEELEGIAYFAEILKADLETTADATRHLLRLLAGGTGQMSVRYVKNLLVGFGVCCGHHGKVNEYLNALAQAGWISQVAGYVTGHRGRLWQVGERMLAKFLTTINKPLSASIFVSHPSRNRAVGMHFPLLQQTKTPLPLYLHPIAPTNKLNRWQKEERMKEIVGKSFLRSSDYVPSG